MKDESEGNLLVEPERAVTRTQGESGVPVKKTVGKGISTNSAAITEGVGN